MIPSDALFAKKKPENDLLHIKPEQLIKKGYITDMVLAGAAISTPTCGPCLGGHMGILAAGERAVSTTNRNFVGRMGHTESEVYLASPAVAAASAITGKISSPSGVCGGEK